MKKTLIFIVILMLVLSTTGCTNRKEQGEFSLLFTPDYASGFFDYSYLVTYDKTGSIVDEKVLDGALFYNIIKCNDTYIVNNGLRHLTLDSDYRVMDERNFNNGWVFEVGDYFWYNNTPFIIYNGGFRKAGNESYTTIQNCDDFTHLELIGFNEGFGTNGKYLYMLLSRNENVDSMERNIAKIDLESFQIVETKKLPGLERKTGTFTKCPDLTILNDHLIIFETKRKKNSNEKISGKLKTVSLNDYRIAEYDITDFILKEDLLYISFFKFKDKVYFFTRGNRLYELSLNESPEIVEVGIHFPVRVGGFPLTLQHNDRVFVVTPRYMIELDMEKKEIVRQITLEQKKFWFRTLCLYSFTVK